MKKKRDLKGMTGRNLAKKIKSKALIRAIKGSCGIISVIARRIGATRSCIDHIINKRPGREWDRVRRHFSDEQEKVVDLGESTVHHLIKQRKDLGEAGRTARWFLEKRRAKKYADQKTVTLQGNKESPLQVETKNVVDITKLALPIEVRKLILDAIEKEQAGGAQASADQG